MKRKYIPLILLLTISKAKALLPILFFIGAAVGILGRLAIDAFSNALEIPLNNARRPAVIEQAMISVPLNVPIQVAVVAAPMDNTITVLPTALETSTNLVDWTPCVSIYFNSTEPCRFFRNKPSYEN